MKISIITTIRHNIGDDFVREGIKYLLRQCFRNEHLDFQYIHKHSPITSRYGFENFRYLRLSRHIDKIIPKKWTNDRILESDLVVQSGAPVYWCHESSGSHCYQNEWYTPLIRERFLQNPQAKLLNLAAGSCQRYVSDGSEFCENCIDYLRELHNVSTVTTVRDHLAQTILHNNGVNVPLIPCSSIFAIDEYGLKNEGADYVVINYMKGAGHFNFDDKIDYNKWEAEFKKFYYRLKENEEVVCVCHNQLEMGSILAIDSGANIFFANHDHIAYMKFYSKAKFGIMNRIHGAYLLASYGKPSIVIGNDSRARMAEEIGLKHYYVNEVDSDLLEKEYKLLLSMTTEYEKLFKIKKENSFNDYMKVLSTL